MTGVRDGHGEGLREAVSGARYVRADLHVHTFLAPGEPQPAVLPSLDGMLEQARARGVAIIGITDHNSTANTRAAVAKATPDLLVLPGIEVTTADGDLLALFSPGEVDALDDLARRLDLLTLPNGAQRSAKGIVQLVREIDAAGGLAIAAHVDTADGLLQRASNATKRDLLVQPGLVGIEFTRREFLAAFSDADTDSVGRECWAQRRATLGNRAALARIMSSDAHSPDDVGREEPHRSVTRLRVDDLNFLAVAIALRNHPNVRCQLEDPLPPSYPHVVSASFTGGFLDGVELDFSANLNCLIGSRGSGKTTALRALQLALGAIPDAGEDDHPNMPDRTEVRFIDALGSERVVERERHGVAVDVGSAGVGVTLRFHDLEQNVGREFLDETEDDPRHTRDFLDGFCDFEEVEGREALLVTTLESNAEVIRRTGRAGGQLTKLRKEKAELERGLKAAAANKLELVAKYAQVLTRERELRDAMQASMEPLGRHSLPRLDELDDLAGQYGVDLTDRPISDVLIGNDGVAVEWERLRATLAAIERSVRVELANAVEKMGPAMDRWVDKHKEWERRVEERREALQREGLKLQLSELERLRRRLGEVDRDIRTFTAWETERREAWAARRKLYSDLRRERDRRYEQRCSVAKELSAALTRQAPSLLVSIAWRREGMRRPWGDWLGRAFGFKSPRSERLAEAVTPAALADIGWRRAKDELAAISFKGERFFDGDVEAAMEKLFNYDVLFELDTMALDDLPEIRVRQEGEAPGPGLPLRERSLGQIRAVILGFILASKDDAPLILDQPEDHLDALFLAETVVRYLHSAKERRQVIVATHNANVTVLGDAELVVPLEPTGAHSRPRDEGAVDNARTQEWVVRLLEGGRDAYRNRGERYGYRPTT